MRARSTGEIDADRLWSRLSELAQIGKSDGGGVTRLSFTEEERAAKDLVASYMREASLAVREDAAGNLIGRREGSAGDVPVVLTGSHVDSVRNGGDFDGPLGMLAKHDLSHNPAEYSSKDDCAVGAEVLYRTLLKPARKT